MALQTLILRPNGNVADSNTPNFSRVPSETADDALYLLINEAVADDDATYIGKGNLAVLVLSFPWEQIENVSPIAMRLVVRFKASAETCQVRLCARWTNDSGNTTNSWTEIYCTAIDTYKTYSADVVDFASFKNSLPQTEYWLETSDEDTKASSTVCLTQLYLEVDYDDEAGGDEPTETPALYIKKSGAWEAVYGTVYNKVNGAWVEGDLSALSAGDNIIVEEL